MCKLPLPRWKQGNYPVIHIYACAMLKTYEQTPIFIPVDITEEAVESAAQIFPGITGPGGTDLEALHGWLLKFG